MSRASGTIVINGTTYDTASGSPIVLKTNPKRIDGFAPMSRPVKQKLKPSHKAAQTSKVVHQTPSRTKTLNRRYVKKPNLTSETAPKHHPVKHHPAHHVDSVRLHKALRTSQSPIVTRFAPTQPSLQPSAQTTTADAPPIEDLTPSGESAARQAKTLVSRKEQLIAEGFEKVRSHQTASTRKRRRGVTVGTSVASFLIVAGIITYFNIPNIAVKVAASKAGISASMPNYTAGFHRSGPISYNPGQITLNFTTSVDDRSFAITQKKSLWDSQSLLSNYVTSETSEYEIFRDRGLTLYIYNGSNATWVDGGIWYTIAGDSRLTPDQLLKIAASM